LSTIQYSEHFLLGTNAFLSGKNDTGDSFQNFISALCEALEANEGYESIS
jgi:hypothetical protein